MHAVVRPRRGFRLPALTPEQPRYTGQRIHGRHQEDNCQQLQRPMQPVVGEQERGGHEEQPKAYGRDGKEEFDIAVWGRLREPE